jgi:signal transduction histidine kinase
VLTIWISRILLIWGRHIRAIEAVLAGSVGVPTVPRTGERELDRVIDALNEAGVRLAEAYRQSEAMAARVARAERLAGLGRVAAGVAHEIRNPLAAARLQGENALAGDDARRRSAILSMLGQIDRLDALTAELLAMTQRTEPRPIAVEIASFLEEAATRHRTAAQARQIALMVRGCDGACEIDRAMVHRVLDNLLANAIRHARPGGSVILSGSIEAGHLIISVEDDGDGVPESIANSLFEPFVTGRPDGTGLGLAIARELADAHGGRLVLRRAIGSPRAGGDDPSLTGALFALELPCRPS